MAPSTRRKSAGKALKTRPLQRMAFDSGIVEGIARLLGREFRGERRFSPSSRAVRVKIDSRAGFLEDQPQHGWSRRQLESAISNGAGRQASRKEAMPPIRNTRNLIRIPAET